MQSLELESEDIKLLFQQLEKALECQKLPTERGEFRQAKVREFMLMDQVNMAGIIVRAKFKHIASRNYLYMDYNPLYIKSAVSRPKLVIPKGGPFHLGFFDLLN